MFFLGFLRCRNCCKVVSVFVSVAATIILHVACLASLETLWLGFVVFVRTFVDDVNLCHLRAWAKMD